MASATRLYLFWSGATGDIPTGWTRETSWNDKFIRLADVYDGTGSGSDTHTHTTTNETCGVCVGTTVADPGITTVAHPGHGHTIGSGTVGNSSGLPPYCTLHVIYNSETTTEIPENAIAMFESAPASGFTAYTTANQHYIRTTASAGSAEANNDPGTHTHSITGTTGNNDTTESIQTAVVSIADDPHTHTYTITADAQTWSPNAYQLLLYKSDSTQNMPSGLLALFNGDVPSGWTLVSSNGSAYDNRLLYANSSTGQTGANHTHNASGPSDGPSATTTTDVRMPMRNAATGTHTHTISMDTVASNPDPAYIDLVLGEFQGVTEAGAYMKPTRWLWGFTLLHLGILSLCYHFSKIFF